MSVAPAMTTPESAPPDTGRPVPVRAAQRLGSTGGDDEQARSASTRPVGSATPTGRRRARRRRPRSSAGPVGGTCSTTRFGGSETSAARGERRGATRRPSRRDATSLHATHRRARATVLRPLRPGPDDEDVLAVGDVQRGRPARVEARPDRQRQHAVGAGRSADRRCVHATCVEDPHALDRREVRSSAEAVGDRRARPAPSATSRPACDRDATGHRRRRDVRSCDAENERVVRIGEVVHPARRAAGHERGGTAAGASVPTTRETPSERIGQHPLERRGACRTARPLRARVAARAMPSTTSTRRIGAAVGDAGSRSRARRAPG